MVEYVDHCTSFEFIRVAYKSMEFQNQNCQTCNNMMDSLLADILRDRKVLNESPAVMYRHFQASAYTHWCSTHISQSLSYH